MATSDFLTDEFERAHSSRGTIQRNKHILKFRRYKQTMKKGSFGRSDFDQASSRSQVDMWSTRRRLRFVAPPPLIDRLNVFCLIVSTFALLSSQCDSLCHISTKWLKQRFTSYIVIVRLPCASCAKLCRCRDPVSDYQLVTYLWLEPL